MYGLDYATMMNAAYVFGVMLLSMVDFSDTGMDDDDGSDDNVFDTPPDIVPLDSFLGTDGPDDVVADNDSALVYTLGAGDDTLVAGNGDDDIRAETGHDSVQAGGGNDQVILGAGNDVLLAGDGDDRATGSSGNDTLSDGNGNDLMRGGAQDDSVMGDAGDDTLTGDDGNDVVDGGSGTDLVLGDGGDDTLSGGTGTATEADGVDTLHGGAGDDLLNLRAGDQGEGGTGADTFALDTSTPADTDAPTGLMQLTDFNAAEDQIVIQFDADTDPGDLEITALEDGTGSIISLGGTDIAHVTTSEEIDPDSIVLQAV